MSVTAWISHEPIGPCGPLEQSSDSVRQFAMEDLSSSLVCGAHAVRIRVVSSALEANQLQMQEG